MKLDNTLSMLLVLPNMCHATSQKILNLLWSSADIFCKQLGPKSGPTEHPAGSGSKVFDTLIVFLKEFLEKSDFEKKSVDNKKEG